MVFLCLINSVMLSMLQVMAKYGELYGSARVSELLGLDKAALDFSSEAQESKRPVQKVAL